MSHSHTHTDREMIYSMSENIAVTSESLLSLSLSLAHIHCFSTSQLLATESPQSSFFLIFLSFFFCLFIIQCRKPEPSLCVPLRGETAVKNILFFMSNFPLSHSPAQIKHATFRERERNSEWFLALIELMLASLLLYGTTVTVFRLSWHWVGF